MTEDQTAGPRVDGTKLPQLFPTHRQTPEFWEALGRCVATFGFLEEVLGKAILAIIGTIEYSEDIIEEEFNKAIETLKKAASEPLGSRINLYERQGKKHPHIHQEQLSDLTKKLKSAKKARDMICHSSWQPGAEHGLSRTRFVDRNRQLHEMPVDVAYLQKLQIDTTALAMEVINSITEMGYQFPGSNGPGKKIW